MKRSARFNCPEKPLVTIVIHSNSSHNYLTECLDSILNQTYDNLEICFYDLNSCHESWEILTEFQNQNPGIMTLIKIKNNYRKDNFTWIHGNIRGKYFVKMCSQDRLVPEFVEKCVDMLENNLEAAFVTVNSKFLKSDFEAILSIPLYKNSCLIDGIKHIPLLLKQFIINNKSFSMYNTDIVSLYKYSTAYEIELEMCLNNKLVYLSEPLFEYREFGRDLYHESGPKFLDLVLSNFMVKHNFIKRNNKYYRLGDIDKILEEVNHILSNHCLNYSISALIKGNEKWSKQFFYLSIVLNLDAKNDFRFQKLEKYWNANSDEQELLKKDLILSEK